MIKDFSLWSEYEGASEGSGRSEKVWLTQPQNRMNGLFKFNKSETTTEHLSEIIASDIAKAINIECAYIELGLYQGRLGCMSYQINNSHEQIVEGIHLINKYYEEYDPLTFYDSKIGEYYSLEMILTALGEFEFKYDFLKIMIFDFITGNTDRHQNNWAILKQNQKIKMCPLYDNGSSLCSYVMGNNINNYLGNDRVRFMSLVDSKSTSRIRIDKYLKKEPTHLNVLKHISNNYYNEISAFVTEISKTLTEEVLDEILSKYDTYIIDSNKKNLIKKFLLSKVILLKNVFNL